MQLTLVIDGITVQAGLGATILDAAGTAGVRIPTLCHDDKLHPYGVCRICMVEIEGPARRMQPACTTTVSEGMVVHTRSAAVMEARRSILELLLINHPLDCPVCDKAGQCRLQDLVHEYELGPGIFAETKRTSPVDHSSPVIERNQDRCILCGKCVRICAEGCAVGALTFAGRGGRSRISAAFGAPLDCEFCGECVDICPVGALTVKQSLHKVRQWNLDQTPSVCVYCGCGCPVILDTRKGAVVRARPAAGGYLCAKGRFGWDAVRHRSRLSTPKMRVNGVLVDCSWDEALSVVATNLKVVRNRYGAGSIGGLGSTRTTNEDNYVFQKFMRAVVGTNNVDLLGRSKMPQGLNSAFFSGEYEKLQDHDVILLDKDAAEINPLLGIEIVRAVNRRGSKLIVMGGTGSKFDAIASVVIPQDGEAPLAGLSARVRSSQRAAPAAVRKAGELLAAAASIAVIMPLRFSPDAADLVQELADLGKEVAHYPLVPRGNLQGALDMGVVPGHFPGYQSVMQETAASFGKLWNAPLSDRPGMNALEMLKGTANSGIAALYIMGDDPVGTDPDLKAALKRLEFLVVQDIFLTETARMAHVVLPAASFLEKDGTFTNAERRLQRIAKVEETFGESQADWEIIQALAQRMGSGMHYGSAADILKEIRIAAPVYAGLAAGACWPGERSPLRGAISSLSLASDAVCSREVITAGKLLFSSGCMISRSKEMGTIGRAMEPVDR